MSFGTDRDLRRLIDRNSIPRAYGRWVRGCGNIASETRSKRAAHARVTSAGEDRGYRAKGTGASERRKQSGRSRRRCGNTIAHRPAKTLAPAGRPMRRDTRAPCVSPKQWILSSPPSPPPPPTPGILIVPRAKIDRPRRISEGKHSVRARARSSLPPARSIFCQIEISALQNALVFFFSPKMRTFRKRVDFLSSIVGDRWKLISHRVLLSH